MEEKQASRRRAAPACEVLAFRPRRTAPAARDAVAALTLSLERQLATERDADRRLRLRQALVFLHEAQSLLD